MKRPAAAIVVALAATAMSVPPASAATGVDSTGLRTAVTVAGLQEHLTAFSNHAQLSAPAFGYPTRVDGSAGFDASVAYAADVFRAAGYTVTLQQFTFDRFVENSSAFAQTAPSSVPYVENTDYSPMEYSGSGDVAAAVQAVDLVLPPTAVSSSTSGCEAADFAGFTAGSIALIQRGTCTFRVKADNAVAAGASGVIIFNEGQEGRTDLLFGTLAPPQVGIPVVGTTFALGNTLAATSGPRVRIAVDATVVTTPSTNVFAESVGGRSDRTVVVGAHLDSVTEGPGINDNGSGSAVVLELAQAMSEKNVAPRNKVRFALWGAEEFGLLGAEYYVSRLSARQLKDIALNINLDMVGSPNYVRFVYDGDGSSTDPAGPNGSGVIEDVFTDYFDAKGLATEPTAFDGRSDYGPFIDRGIPAGGLFTGAEGIKTAAEAAVYGGTAGVAYDPCYHQPCDGLTNVSTAALDEMSDASAHAVLQFAMTTSAVNGTGKAATTATASTEYRGNRQRK